ncbi:multidrug ABC transporter [Clostridium carboxidivorans P7]|uniref:Stage 0 sporulation protein A homolog n=1 Tax=Clostridium carboxidivorans P7 TaxID=536227 RepID=C6PSI3_9CLOT|nr:response regulator transcription factor [Clostridium carboxidivorans]AKN30620.1 multidrug ABC transporter [Clostridium carboxidivorans P7]EET87757.1 two component transcriptional regulator, winged helix family [Clostridium carboxidivorans P7]EFG86373.1 subtilin biosynthesis regulatory protein SpaR [Clostridium carboxidivorans P7]
MAKILVIDDEKDILVLVKNVLAKDGHVITIVDDAKKLSVNEYTKYDLILLDVMMPDIDGFELCKKIRELVDSPILFLTARTMESDIMFGLGIGGDDYITKPFGTGELRARVNAHLRRENREKHNMISVSGMKFNLASKEIIIQDRKVPMTKSEYAICEFLVRNRGQVFTKEQIYEAVYGYERESDSSGIAEHIKNIRAKLLVFELSPIETVWGIGYKWE